jgi:hypothetical protein
MQGHQVIEVEGHEFPALSARRFCVVSSTFQIEGHGESLTSPVGPADGSASID